MSEGDASECSETGMRFGGLGGGAPGVSYHPSGRIRRAGLDTQVLPVIRRVFALTRTRKILTFRVTVEL